MPWFLVTNKDDDDPGEYQPYEAKTPREAIEQFRNDADHTLTPYREHDTRSYDERDYRVRKLGPPEEFHVESSVLVETKITKKETKS